MRVITVWRDKAGPSLATYSKVGSRTPLISNLDHLDTEVGFVPKEDALRELVTSREPFEEVFVPVELVEPVLGWKVEA